MKVIFLFISLFILTSCNPGKKATETKPVETQTEQAPAADELGALNNLVVSFYSTGSGTNYKAALMLEDFISDYSRKTKTVVPMKKTPWGKEGEVDYCIELSGWQPEVKEKFIKSVKDMLRGIQVHIYENHPCKRL